MNYDKYIRKFFTCEEAEEYAAELRKHRKVSTDVFRVWLRDEFFFVEQDIA